MTNAKAQISNQTQSSNVKSFWFSDFELDLEFGFWNLDLIIFAFHIHKFEY